MKIQIENLAGIVLVCFLIISSAILPAQVERCKAWVWADQPGATSYTPHAAYQFNSSGGTNQITRLGVGHYRVDFPGLGTPGGMVQVSSYGGNHFAKVERWWQSGTTQSVIVRCFNSTGSAVDGQFTALFYKERRRTSIWDAAYLWADQPTATQYTPSRTYQWNSKGQINTVRRMNTGHYQVTLPAISISSGTVLITTYGTGSERSKVESWQPSGNALLVNVRCFKANGNPVDTQFTLSFMNDAALGIDVSEDQHLGGYLWANNPTAPSYTPNSTYQLNNANATNTIRRLATGHYEATFPMLKSSNRSVALVTAYGNGSEYATIERWSSDGNNGTKVYIKCFNSQGNPVDTRFTLLYLTDEQILY